MGYKLVDPITTKNYIISPSHSCLDSCWLIIIKCHIIQYYEIKSGLITIISSGTKISYQ